jgi:hypothetical protein
MNQVPPVEFAAKILAASEQLKNAVDGIAMCDLKDMLTKLESVQQLLPLVIKGKTQLDQYWSKMEQIDNQDTYLKIAKIADQLGEKLIYDIGNKYLSKFVHPTSVSIQSRKDPRLMLLAVQGIAQTGSFFVETSFPVLIGCLNAIQPPPKN